MKLFTGILATAVLSASLMTGCSMSPKSEAAAQPMIKLTAMNHNIETGTTTRVTAHSANLVGARNIQWTVSPNVANIRPDSNSGQTAIFSANQAGTYIVKASADLGNGQWVSDETTITVNGVLGANGQPLDNNNSNTDSNRNANNR